MVWIRRDFKNHLVPTPCHGQGHLSGEQLAQSPNQSVLEHFQDWDIHFSGQPVKNMECFMNLGGFLVVKMLILARP